MKNRKLLTWSLKLTDHLVFISGGRLLKDWHALNKKVSFSFCVLGVKEILQFPLLNPLDTLLAFKMYLARFSG